MRSTIDAAALCKMAERGQITGGVVDGPLAFDNAINEAAAAEKGIISPVAGRADILVVPDLEAGNMLAKQLTFLAGAEAAGVVLGARVPIILTSRADSAPTRLASCALGGAGGTERRGGQHEGIDPHPERGLIQPEIRRIRRRRRAEGHGARRDRGPREAAPHMLARDAAGAVLAERRWPAGAGHSFADALDALLAFADAHLGRDGLAAVGHRVVHGGADHIVARDESRRRC